MGSISRSIRERLAFFHEFRAHCEETGSVQPSSKHLAHAMTRELRQARAGRPGNACRILEVGPGTGAITRAIAGCMHPGDRLHCYEINPTFARFLAELLHEDPALRLVAEQVVLVNAPAQELRASEPFDFAICSAPLNNFDAEAISAIFTAVLGHLKNGGTLTFFEYLLFPGLRRMLSRGAARSRLERARAEKERYLREYGRSSAVVARNLPPARVHHLRRNAA